MAKRRLTATEAESIAYQRIEENYAKKDEWLDLGDLLLERLPESIRKLEHLRVLALGHQAIQRDELRLSFGRYDGRDMPPLTNID